MKRYFLFLIVFFSLTAASSCTSASIKEKQNIQREWMLVSMKSFSKEELTKNKAGINLSSAAENGKIRGTAFMGCNRMFFNAEINSGNQIKISGLGGTLMACEEMNVEKEFSNIFENMNRFEIEGHFLMLSDENGNSMKFVAADWD